MTAMDLREQARIAAEQVREWYENPWRLALIDRERLAEIARILEACGEEPDPEPGHAVATTPSRGGSGERDAGGGARGAEPRSESDPGWCAHDDEPEPPEPVTARTHCVCGNVIFFDTVRGNGGGSKTCGPCGQRWRFLVEHVDVTGYCVSVDALDDSGKLAPTPPRGSRTGHRPESLEPVEFVDLLRTCPRDGKARTLKVRWLAGATPSVEWVL